jgi:hypothetical protein
MGRHLIRNALTINSLGAIIFALVGTFKISHALIADQTPTTAWRTDHFHVDVANVVRQSNVILLQPNMNANQSMPLGNGKLGVAIWSGNGLTVQLNRVDTFPNRKSPGQVVIPGLSVLTKGANYHGSLDLYDAMFRESGGKMTATAYILQNKDELIIDVTGANPNETQTAQIQLWPGRSPTARADGAFASLAETFVDNPGCCGAGASNQTFGSLAGITAGGRNVTASVVNPTTIQVSFKPNTNGSFRIVVASPSWAGKGNALSTITNLIGNDATASTSRLQNTHLKWWHTFWKKTGLIKMSSSDGKAAYIENIRDIDLYVTAASSSDKFPGHYNGAINILSWNRDNWRSIWPIYLFWHWNLRMQVPVNMAAGHPELNNPYFNLYNSNLANLKAWTKQKFDGDGTDICVPELIRFNGNGAGGSVNETCDQSVTSFNGKTLSTGAEVSLWMWQHYLYTGDRTFLQKNYPFMAAAARFLLHYSKVGSDGHRHTNPSNAHETQWDVHDPTTDIAAMKALFPVVIQAARMLKTDATLASQLRAALPQILDYPRTDIGSKTQLLTASADSAGKDMIGMSYDPTAPTHNSENIGLEVVWPYGLIGDGNGSMTQLAQRTFTYRSTVNSPDWTFDAVDAARIGDAADFQSSVIKQVQAYQVWASGLGNWSSNGSDNLPYDEMDGDVANAVQEALVQDYDGVLRIAPAWPSDWNVSGTVYIHGNSKVDVQIENGKLVTAVIQTGSNGTIVTRNPWKKQKVTVVDSSSRTTVVAATTAKEFTIPARSGHSYVIELVSSPLTAMSYAQVTARPATTTRSMGSVTIGIPR